jgi:DNA-directed RNA polymerase sigma subunit (sigma70/sigma32)
MMPNPVPSLTVPLGVARYIAAHRPETLDDYGVDLTCLTVREYRVIQERYEFQATLAEIGTTLHMSKERARCIEAKALRKIRQRYLLNHRTTELPTKNG